MSLSQLRNKIIDQLPEFIKKTTIADIKNKFTTEEKKALYMQGVYLSEAIDDYMAELERRGATFPDDADDSTATVTEVDIDLGSLEDDVAVDNQPTTWKGPSLPAGVSCIVEVVIGRTFKGDEHNTVIVPVLQEPKMHKSANSRWSWRTVVAGYDDFRHINVSNLHSILKDGDGKFYVRVDRTWRTEQPVFKDVCNK